jgi:ABC-type ATPase with predicted acetyltransferase domain
MVNEKGSRSQWHFGWNRDFLLEPPAISLLLGKQERLSYPALMVKPDDRIAVTGPNGAGKSTLIRHIVDSLNVPEEHVTFVPQEIDTLQSKKILARVLGLPDHQLGHLMTMISRLGSRPHRLLDSIEPSPGQIRLLFCSILTFTHLRAPSRFSAFRFRKYIQVLYF